MVAKKTEMTEKNLFCYLPKEDHTAFKIACAEHGIAMSDVLRRLVQNWLKANIMVRQNNGNQTPIVQLLPSKEEQ